jgi:hypothetical protein
MSYYDRHGREDANGDKRVLHYNEYLRTFYDKRLRFRFPAKAKRFSDEQYGAVLRSSTLSNTVMIGRHGLVKSNFALAEVANSRPCHRLSKVRFSKMTQAEVRSFTQDMKDVAERNGWSPEMLDIELQFLGDYR